MFQRTLSFWKRLLGRSPSEPSEATEQDRRVWVRYPADLETTYAEAGGGGRRLAARVRNVSLGGVNLAVDRPLDPGALLSIELPEAGEHTPSAVLACVVHVTQASAEEWHAGCTFSRELTETDLEAFGAQRPAPEAGEQRIWPRFACDVKAVCQAVANPESGPQPARVLNLSRSGVGLLLPKRFDNGTLLSVEFQAADSSFRRTVLACVVRINARPDGQQALGCNFIRSLSEEDLRLLL
ncbi:MAG: PilZ domain-containing protein [Gemmataceae bacterium]|nr:PilZ domain-containing protein [Gemmataceae bacterium]